MPISTYRGVYPEEAEAAPSPSGGVFVSEMLVPVTTPEDDDVVSDMLGARNLGIEVETGRSWVGLKGIWWERREEASL